MYILNELPQNPQKKKRKKKQVKKTTAQPPARLVITINGKNYYITQFTNKPIIPFRNTNYYSISIQDKKYIVGKIKKGQLFGYNYQLYKGRDGQWWFVKRIAQGKYYFVPAKDVLNNEYLKQYQPKTIEDEKKEVEQKIKEAQSKTFTGIFNKALTIPLLIGAGILLLK